MRFPPPLLVAAAVFYTTNNLFFLIGLVAAIASNESPAYNPGMMRRNNEKIAVAFFTRAVAAASRQ
jgi:hypothetical protein